LETAGAALSPEAASNQGSRIGYRKEEAAKKIAGNVYFSDGRKSSWFYFPPPNDGDDSS